MGGFFASLDYAFIVHVFLVVEILLCLNICLSACVCVCVCVGGGGGHVV